MDEQVQVVSDVKLEDLDAVTGDGLPGIAMVVAIIISGILFYGGIITLAVYLIKNMVEHFK